MKGRAGDRKRSPANRTLFGPVDHNQNKLDVSRIWTRLNERARTRVVDPTTDLESGGGTRGGEAGVGSSTDEEESGGGGGDDTRTRTREVSPSGGELLRTSPGGAANDREFVLRSGTPGCGDRDAVTSAESPTSSRPLIGGKSTCVTLVKHDSMRLDTSCSPSSTSNSTTSTTTATTRTSSVTTSVLKSTDCPWRAPFKHCRGDPEAPALQRPSLRPADVEGWQGELHRPPLRPPAPPRPPSEEAEFRRIPVVQLVAGGDGVCPQEAQRQKCFFKPIRGAATGRRSSEDEEAWSRDGDGLPGTKRKRKKDGEGGGDDDDDDDGDDDDDDVRASCWVQTAVRSGSEMFNEPGIKSETLNRRLNEIAIPKKSRTFEDADDDKTPL